MLIEPEQVLFPGERLLWTGRPQRARRSIQELGIVAYLIFGVPAFFAFAFRPIFNHSQPWWFVAGFVVTAVGAISQAIGYVVYMLVIMPRTRASATYAVTDRRVIVTSTGLRTRVANSIYLSTLPSAQITKSSDATGTVRFGSSGGGSRLTRLPQPLRHVAPALTLPALSLADAETALAAITQARTAASDTADQAREASTAFTSAAAATLVSASTSTSTATPTNTLPVGWTPSPGEQVLWAGHPSRVRWWYGGHDVYTSLFGVAWTAMVVLLEWATITSHAWPFSVLLLAFLAFGIYAIIGRVVWRRARIRRSTYLVTTQRVATVWSLRRPSVVSARLADVRPPTLSADGTLTFTATSTTPAPARTSPPSRRSGQGIATLLSPAATTEAPIFIDVDDAATVYRLVGAAQAAVPNTASDAASSWT